MCSSDATDMNADLTRGPLRHNNGFVPFASLGRRSFAVIVSLLLSASPLLPSAHVHFADSPAGSLKPVVVHQHAEPHRVAAHHQVSLSEDDDDGTVQTIGQEWLVPDAGCRHSDLQIASFQPLLAPPLEHGARVQTSSGTTSPQESPPRTDSLRAPPSPFALI
jgi:hypothetical protein